MSLSGKKERSKKGSPTGIVCATFRGGGAGLIITQRFIYTVFRARRITFFLVNRIENQNEPKRSQSCGRLGSFLFSTRPSADTGTDYNQDFDYGKNRGAATEIVP